MSEFTRGLKIAILEDNADRTVAMRSVLAEVLYMYEPHFFPTAPLMVEWLEHHIHETLMISLDHDLELPVQSVDRTDPGTGRDVADALAERVPSCPVVIHTTNGPAGEGMVNVLNDALWQTHRVVPYDDLRWVRETWLPVIRSALFDLAEVTPSHVATATVPTGTGDFKALSRGH